MPKEFHYEPMFQTEKGNEEYYLLTKDGISTAEFEGKTILKVSPEALTEVARAAFRDCAFLLRKEHQLQVAAILDDEEASENDKFVALTMLQNAEVSAKGVLPFCQDTGTAIIVAKKGQRVWTDFSDEEALSKGVYLTYRNENLRYSQNAAFNMYDEINTGTNLPAQIDIQAVEGDEYKFLFIAKGGGSSNKTYLFQETKALLNPESLEKFLSEKVRTLGTAGCPPYHIAFVIGGTSADICLKTAKLASTKYYDTLPTNGNEYGRAFRDIELEQKILHSAWESGYGAQFGGKYFAHDVRIIRLPRHGASCCVGMAVSCSADRNILAKINKDGVWVEKLEENPAALIPERYRKASESEVVKGTPNNSVRHCGLDPQSPEKQEILKQVQNDVCIFRSPIKIDLNQPMSEILKTLSQYPVATRLSLSGTIVVGRDIAHAKLKELIDSGKGLPQYIKDHPIYYAGPAKTPKGMPSGSFGPTTAGRMDSYVDLFQSQGGSLVMIAKGDRTQQVTDACKKYGGFYLGSIGGPAAILAQNNIKKVECLQFPELGMEAIWKIEVEEFPAFILIDDKGNDFFKQLIN